MQETNTVIPENEEPHRYITSGHRNWLVLKKNVMLLQSKLNGSLPTRNNESFQLIGKGDVAVNLNENNIYQN
jgi:hypothetical protein